MTRLARTLSARDASTQPLWDPRDDVVVESIAGEGRFVARTGPFTAYERTLTTDHDGSVTEVIEFTLAPLVYVVPFGLLLRRTLAHRPAAGTKPFWAPPETTDAAAATTIGALCTLALVFGYLGTLLSQTITFAADELDASKAQQGATLAAVRIGVLAALALTALADRRGRRQMLLVTAAAACVLSALGALAPDLWTLGASQAIVRGLTTAGAVLLAIVAAEEMPSGSRAFAISLLTMSGALGVGMCLWALPIADTGVRAWRLIFALSLLGLPLVRLVARHLRESRRFVETHLDVSMAGHGRRFWLLAASGVAAQPLHGTGGPAHERVPPRRARLLGGPHQPVHGPDQHARRHRHHHRWAAGRHARTTAGGGGRRGGRHRPHRRDGPRGGWPMWALSVLGAVIGAATVPALGVYGPELFPTSLRGRANGIIAILGVAGSVIGLLVAGFLSDRWDGLGPALAVLSIGPALMAVLVLVAYPETAHRELEDLNPEDRVEPTTLFASAPSDPPVD